MSDIIDELKDLDGVTDTRSSKYQQYIPRDTRIEGYGTVSELLARIARLEKQLQEVLVASQGEK